MNRSVLSTLRVAVFSLFLGPFAIGLAYADDTQDVAKLLKDGQAAQALDGANKILAKTPKDKQVRFIKGLALIQLAKNAEAIKVFQGLTEDFPELPEPYNNLAVLYAQQNQYDKARQALEMAIQTHPSYAAAHENLGDIYAQLASQAYNKALQFDKGNTAAQTKLSLIGELFSSNLGGRVKAATKPETPVTPPITVAQIKPTTTKVEPPKNDPAKVEPPKVTPTKPTPIKPAEPVAPDTPDEKPVLSAVNSWAAAWSGQRVSAYLASYGSAFKPPKGASRSAWEAERRDRLTAPKSIDVGVEGAKVKFIDARTAQVSFTQRYQSDALKTHTGKTLLLTKSGDRWLIVEERVGR